MCGGAGGSGGGSAGSDPAGMGEGIGLGADSDVGDGGMGGVSGSDADPGGAGSTAASSDSEAGMSDPAGNAVGSTGDPGVTGNLANFSVSDIAQAAMMAAVVNPALGIATAIGMTAANNASTAGIGAPGTDTAGQGPDGSGAGGDAFFSKINLAGVQATQDAAASKEQKTDTAVVDETPALNTDAAEEQSEREQNRLRRQRRSLVSLRSNEGIGFLNPANVFRPFLF